MSRKIFVVLHILALSWIVTFTLCPGAAAQDPQLTHRVEIFGGYTYNSTDLLETPGVVPGVRQGFNGWDAEVTWMAQHNVGFTAAFNGTYGSQNIPSVGKTQGRLYTFLFGPKLVHHMDKFEVYGHVLAGAARASTRFPDPTTGAKIDVKDTNFALAVGAGLDYAPNKRVGIRVVQGEYVAAQVYSAISNHIRVSAGVIVRW